MRLLRIVDDLSKVLTSSGLAVRSKTVQANIQHGIHDQAKRLVSEIRKAIDLSKAPELAESDVEKQVVCCSDARLDDDEMGGVSRGDNHTGNDPSSRFRVSLQQTAGHYAAWNPRLDHGLLWAGYPPSQGLYARNIEAEVQGGRDSFVARILYAALMHAREQLGTEDGPSPKSPVHMFRLTRRYEPVEITRWRSIECYKRIHNHGTPLTKEQLEAEQRSAIILEAKIERDYQALEDPTGRGLTVFEIEGYLRDVWSVQVRPANIKRKQMQQTASGRMTVRDSPWQDSFKLTFDISRACVCWGTGPKVPTWCIDDAVRNLTW